jgi:hypothetical protein
LSDFSEIMIGNALRIDRETILTVPEGPWTSPREQNLGEQKYQPPKFGMVSEQ